MAKTLDATESVTTLDAAAPTLDAGTHSLEIACPKCGVFPVRLSMRKQYEKPTGKKGTHMGKRLNKAIEIASILEQNPGEKTTVILKQVGGERGAMQQLLKTLRVEHCVACGEVDCTLVRDPITKKTNVCERCLIKIERAIAGDGPEARARRGLDALPEPVLS